MRRRRAPAPLGGPFLRRITMNAEEVDRTRYPFKFLVSTHSPILLAYPGAMLLSLDGSGITRVEYTETEHYRLTRDFLSCPERYFQHLFAPDDEEGSDPRKR